MLCCFYRPPSSVIQTMILIIITNKIVGNCRFSEIFIFRRMNVALMYGKSDSSKESILNNLVMRCVIKDKEASLYSRKWEKQASTGAKIKKFYQSNSNTHRLIDICRLCLFLA